MSNVGLNTEGTKSLSSLFNGVSYFSYAKPLSLLKLLIRQLINDEGIVLDFFFRFWVYGSSCYGIKC